MSTNCEFFRSEKSSALRKSSDAENGILTPDWHCTTRLKLRLKGHAAQEQATEPKQPQDHKEARTPKGNQTNSHVVVKALDIWKFGGISVCDCEL